MQHSAGQAANTGDNRCESPSERKQQTTQNPACNTVLEPNDARVPADQGVRLTHSPSYSAETALFGTGRSFCGCCFFDDGPFSISLMRQTVVSAHNLPKSNKQPVFGRATGCLAMTSAKYLFSGAILSLTHPASLPKPHYLELCFDRGDTLYGNRTFCTI